MSINATLFVQAVVFAILVLDSGLPDADPLLTTVVVTVALSVFLHGLSAMPLGRFVPASHFCTVDSLVLR